jgi:hypothetical protein
MTFSSADHPHLLIIRNCASSGNWDASHNLGLPDSQYWIGESLRREVARCPAPRHAVTLRDEITTK